ncbi:uncharacterized protein LOC122248967 [Penaeus japonicus]|uniref:uncharacterized protein LOC122248967 n=1 Tax=Penaeus japonicus TaxID=27405 RepID=UPI001C70EE7E|nr:uncharacterized protein LOC122248967 [Penaeus japonicus]
MAAWRCHHYSHTSHGPLAVRTEIDRQILALWCEVDADFMMGGNEQTWGEEEREETSEDEGNEAPSFREKVIALFEKGEASHVLSLMADAVHAPQHGRHTHWDPLLLWVRPSHCCIQSIADHVRDAHCDALASIGCGTGLLEWLIHKLTGTSVVGYEINTGWWSSPYSPPTFIPLVFVDSSDPPLAVPPAHALMCCYFNNGEVFRKYVDSYDGPAMIIIGSIDKNRHTEPRPLDYEDIHPWTLTRTHRISDTDLIGFYVRDQLKVDAVRKLRM